MHKLSLNLQKKNKLFLLEITKHDLNKLFYDSTIYKNYFIKNRNLKERLDCNLR
jgi:hypothetical protein